MRGTSPNENAPDQNWRPNKYRAQLKHRGAFKGGRGSAGSTFGRIKRQELPPLRGWGGWKFWCVPLVRRAGSWKGPRTKEREPSACPSCDLGFEGLGSWSLDRGVVGGAGRRCWVVLASRTLDLFGNGGGTWT
jgi:hypothetical protein